MEIRYTLTREDVSHASRASSSSSWSMFLFVLLLAVMFLVGIILINLEYVLAGWIWLAVSAMIGLAVYEAPLFQARRALEANPVARGEIVCPLDDTGIAVTFLMGHGFREWRAFSKYGETTHLFLLFDSPRRICTFLPKRVMSPQEIAELRSAQQSNQQSFN